MPQGERKTQNRSTEAQIDKFQVGTPEAAASA